MAVTRRWVLRMFGEGQTTDLFATDRTSLTTSGTKYRSGHFFKLPAYELPVLGVA